MSTYTDRQIVEYIVESMAHNRLQLSDGWSHPMPPENADKIQVGDILAVESIGTMDVGWKLDGEWLYRKSDEQLDQERLDMLAENKRKSEEQLEANREDWTRREAALPDAIRIRMDYFRGAAGKAKFEIEGWGYELMICELVVLYLKSDLEDVQFINDYAKEHGTSGNQHMLAKALARHLFEGEIDLYGTVSGLAPLTGSPDYS